MLDFLAVGDALRNQMHESLRLDEARGRTAGGKGRRRGRRPSFGGGALGFSRVAAPLLRRRERRQPCAEAVD